MGMKHFLFRMISYIGSTSTFLGMMSLHENLPGDVVNQLMEHDSILPPHKEER